MFGICASLAFAKSPRLERFLEVWDIYFARGEQYSSWRSVCQRACCLRPLLEENAMAASFGSTFLTCAGIFVLAFVAIWAFWFVERLRGSSAPRLSNL